jgi:cyclic beta-1,2-glucan synthetase
MTEGSNLELVKEDAEDGQRQNVEPPKDKCVLVSAAADLARQLAWIPGQGESSHLRERSRTLRQSLQPLLVVLGSPRAKTESDDLRPLLENIALVHADLESTCGTFQRDNKLPQVRTPDGTILPRIAAVAEGYLAFADFKFNEVSFASYIEAFQEITVLKMAELWMLVPAMKLVLLEQIAERGPRLLQDPSGSYGVTTVVRSLEEIKHAPWKAVIEPLILFDQILRDDPAGAYARMDHDSRDLYRRKLVEMADRSDCSEIKVAREALTLARREQQKPNQNPRVTLRHSHVGRYLVGDGSILLQSIVRFHPSLGQRFRIWLRRHPDDFYLPGVAVLTCAIISAVVLLLTEPSTPLELIVLALLAVLVPSSQSAVQIMNYVSTLLLSAEILPKMDFSDGLPSDCVTLVAIPTMLLTEDQVRKLVSDLEVRYLGNQDQHLHFALLTDLPDSPSEPVKDHPLIDLASDLIRGLNEKYAAKRAGSFFLLHRHRIYNPRERVWMGWERKRGKLMDLNNLLRGQFDNFPVKVGDLPTLSSVRFIITLDSDTDLPRGSARRLVGALAHPLNQAIIDREKGIVVAGYGILQPRVGVSVQSTARSRLAAIYSGQTGLDIYTHATSDVYQDLYGEGIFVGKGIYEVETLHAVLHGRFPRNALLSHDLIEGAYARAGLVSDIEIIEDYPSHYSAHNRRKHRWLRGDWQITEWLLPQVPDESGQRVPNPLSIVSRWKILDNLRRSLVEPALFLLFLLGWTCLPGTPARWTLATIAILFLPALVQLGFELAHATAKMRRAGVVDALNSFVNASIANGLTITFLAHQTLVSLDAVVRTMVRRLITRQRLLQWETAAEAELAGDRRTMLDIYLNWTPALAFGLFLSLWLVDRIALPAALPILLLWACSKPISIWLNRPPRAPRKQVSEADRWLLRISGLRIWRYFAEFSTAEHHWLIPDNVQEDGKLAPRISPTNIGLLFNVRQAACEFGYLTVPEFAQQTLHTLETISRLERHQGHLLNWYDTRSLAPLPPAVVSSVDNGNLVASLWTLQQGCLQLLRRPLVQSELANGLLDYLYLLTSIGALPRRKFSYAEKTLRRTDWQQQLLSDPGAILKAIDPQVCRTEDTAEARWFQQQAEERIRQVTRTVKLYAPWLLPEFAALKNDSLLQLQDRVQDNLPLERVPDYIENLSVTLQAAVTTLGAGESKELYRSLLSRLPEARSHAQQLIADLNKIADLAAVLADEMDFTFLLNPARGLLSIAYEVEKGKIHPACYDLLASEARIAYFVAIAKDEIPQESWFLLGRAPVSNDGITGLLSWTGTMFEYLMPTLWMRIYPNTLLDRSTVVAVRAQQTYAAEKGIPWGISESAFAKLDDAGNYSYFAFGVPQLAIFKPDQGGPVISPYSTFLALSVDPPAALRNLRTMQRKRWLGAYGFYESLDFSPPPGTSRLRRPDVVSCWMAHHLGMSMLSITNLLRDDVVQRWFHHHPRVQATELLLQEKPARNIPQPPRAKAA